jgi:hypothetical protein
MEEDEEELYSEMQPEDGGRRRPSGTSHSALKVSAVHRGISALTDPWSSSILSLSWGRLHSCICTWELGRSCLGAGVWGCTWHSQGDPHTL